MATSVPLTTSDVNRDEAVALVSDVARMLKEGTALAKRLEQAAHLDDPESPEQVVYGLKCIAGREWQQNPRHADDALRLVANGTDTMVDTAERLIRAGGDGLALQLAVRSYRRLQDKYGNGMATIHAFEHAVSCAHDVLGVQ